MKKTKESALQTKEILLETGLTVFNRKGYSRTRLEDIANAAGLSRGAIYHHFENKAQLFKAIIISRIKSIIDVFEGISAESSNPIQSIKNTLAEILIKIEQDNDLRMFANLFSKTHFKDELAELEEHRDYSSWKEFKILIKALTECKRRGQIKHDINLNTFAFTLIAVIDGTFRLYIRSPEMISLNENAHQIIDYLFKGVEPASVTIN
ncbi:MAG: TetR family transcriptional regulator [Ignavibacteriae bacterium]|nr:TetR family transcriptional regulator [Ignavibacteriota bacterium]NOG98389.1 TetR family transcriptional regulator [Ignavibacteriota bacterium]